MNVRELFFSHVAPTSPEPGLGNPLHIVRAKGSLLFDENGKQYIDLISGIAVSSVGHCHPHVVKAVQEQAEKFMHLMVYGEMIQEPQIGYAHTLISLLPRPLEMIYYTTGGSEAIEIALKIARKYTGRKKVLAFKNSYHGSTPGALSLMASDAHRNAYAPLVPGTVFARYNDTEDLISKLTDEIACVVIEAVQAESGVIEAEKDFMQTLVTTCNERGILVVLDEIQTGFGRTGELFAFKHYGIVPDILCLAKGMGGGVPIGACISSKEIFSCLTRHPILGHMNTFGGNALSCAAASATLDVIIQESLCEAAHNIKTSFRDFWSAELKNYPITARICGAVGALEFADEETAFKVCRKALDSGVLTDWFLFNPKALRFAPPLNMEKNILHDALDALGECIKVAFSKQV